MSERFVTIRKVVDSVEAEMLVDLLAQEGIAANAPGAAHASLMGNIGTTLLGVPLMVPESRAEEAKAIIAALREYDELDPEDQPLPEVSAAEGPYRGGTVDDGSPPRKKVTALAVALVLPMIVGAFGAGHFYVHRYKTGFVFLGLGWASVLGATAGLGELIAALPILIALDAWLAMRAIDAQKS